MSASEELPHQTFERLVEEGGLGTLERLPKNCLATYAYRGNGCEEGMVVPLKFAAEAPSTVWQWNYGLYKGLVVLWMTSLKKFLVYDNQRYDGNKPTNSEKIVRVLPDMVRSHTDVGTLLPELAQALYQDLEEVKTKTKSAIATREEFLRLRESTFQLEADAHEELKALLGYSMHLTPEKCKADVLFHMGAEKFCLPIQTKSATLHKRGIASNHFHNTNNYKSMLLFCRPMRRLYVGTVVMPGALAPAQFQIVLNDTSKYAAFLVPDPTLSEFIGQLYVAVRAGVKSFKWPSGQTFEISSIQLQTLAFICLPDHESGRVERESFLWRQKLLPHLRFETPRVQGTAVDVVINGIRVQDKGGCKSRSPDYFHVKICKSGGLRSGKLTEVPYCKGDFDLLWVHVNAAKRYMFLIPEAVLIKQQILAHEGCTGKKDLMCHLPTYQAGKIGRPADPWSKEYCIDTESPNFESKIRSVLDACRLSIDKIEKR